MAFVTFCFCSGGQFGGGGACTSRVSPESASPLTSPLEIVVVSASSEDAVSSDDAASSGDAASSVILAFPVKYDTANRCSASIIRICSELQALSLIHISEPTRRTPTS